jgi:ketosteroid isomerase-like protein
MQAFYAEAVSISKQNVEVVRRAWEAQSRHDNEAVFALYDPRIEIDPGPRVEGPTIYRGFAGVRAWFRDFFGAFESVDVEVEEWIDAGEQVVAVVHFSGRGRQSGVPIELREGHVWTVRGGKLVRLRVYPNNEQALEAVGLRE